MTAEQHETMGTDEDPKVDTPETDAQEAAGVEAETQETGAPNEPVDSDLDEETGDGINWTKFMGTLPKEAKEHAATAGLGFATTMVSYYGLGVRKLKMLDPRWKWAIDHVENKMETQDLLDMISLWGRFKSKVRSKIPVFKFYDAIGKMLPARFRDISMYPVEDLIYYMGVGIIKVPEEVASQAEGQAMQILNLTMKGGTAAGAVIGGAIGVFGGPGGVAAGATEGAAIGTEVAGMAKKAEPFAKIAAEQMPDVRKAVQERIAMSEHPVEETVDEFHDKEKLTAWTSDKTGDPIEDNIPPNDPMMN